MLECLEMYTVTANIQYLYGLFYPLVDALTHAQFYLHHWFVYILQSLTGLKCMISVHSAKSLFSVYYPYSFIFRFKADVCCSFSVIYSELSVFSLYFYIYFLRKKKHEKKQAWCSGMEKRLSEITQIEWLDIVMTRGLLFHCNNEMKYVDDGEMKVYRYNVITQ